MALKPGMIYLLQEREFINNQQPIYKLGQCEQLDTRMQQYPKGSILLFTTKTPNCLDDERELMYVFKQLFIQRNDIGREYFFGNSFDMIRIIGKYFFNESHFQLLFNQLPTHQ